MKNELLRLTSIWTVENNSMLKGADFRICRGESVGLIGGFHSGKRLLMEIVAGTCIPSKGYRFLYGKPVGWGATDGMPKVKHLKKNFGLIGSMKIWENIATYSGEERQFPRIFSPKSMQEKVEHMMAVYGIRADVKTPVDKLTAIQKFAAALMKARLEGVELVLVEDSELEYSVSGFRLMEKLLCLCRDQGMSVMFSGIDMGGFAPLLDRVCLIDAGRIIWEEQAGENFSNKSIFSYGTISAKLNIPVKRLPVDLSCRPSVRIDGAHFSISGKTGEFLLLLEPEPEPGDIFPEPDIHAAFISETERGKRQKLRIRQIDFTYFGGLVKWMSPADNLAFGLSEKTGRFGIVKPHLKRYILKEFVKWTGEEKYLEMRDCESLVIGERIKIAAFRLKLERPDVVVFRHYQLLDQDSREIVLQVFSELLGKGTVLAGISALDNFFDFADGYFLMTGGMCSERMDYPTIRSVLGKE